MINEKSLVANMGLLGSSSQSKKLATNFKRLSGGLQNIRTSDLELSAAEQKAINDAVSVLSAAAGVYRKAMTIQLKNEKSRKENFEHIMELVKSSHFGQLKTLEDKLLLVATTIPYIVNDIAQSAFSAQYAVTQSFGESLDYIARRLAEKPDQFQQELDAAWQRFQEKRPGLLQKYGEKIRKAIELIDAEAAKSVNRV
jgi:hypothetical protein